MLTIRHLKSKSDLDAYMELCVYCFSMPRDYTSVYASFVGQHLEYTWGAFDNDRLVASMWYIPYEMNVGGAYIPMGGIAAVTSLPEVRNSGLAKTLITKAHRQMKDEGRPIAVLAPFKPDFYARMGYGDVFYMQRCKVPPGSIAKLETKGYRLVPIDGEKEWKTFDKLNMKYGARYVGAVKRTSEYWRLRYFQSRIGTRYHYLIMKGKEPVGFIITHMDKPPAAYSSELSRSPELSIVQAVWTDQGSFDMIMQFIRSHRDQFEKIGWVLPPDVSIHDRLADQRIEVALKPKMMLKIVDIKGAMEQRPFSTHLSGEVVIQVQADDTSPWLDGHWRIRWNAGNAKVSKLQNASRTSVVKTDIQTLAVLYSGHKSASRLAELGLVTGSKAAIDLLNCAFPPQTCYMEEWF